MSMVMCKQTQHLLNIPNASGSSLNLQLLRHPPPEKGKVVVVMGATGTGKSRLSIDLATRFPAEVINSDKIQVHEGLDITTNKITAAEQRQVPHHLLGLVNPYSDFTAANFCNAASIAMNSISSRGHLPIIVGGSNSYIEALIDDVDYDCCFLWIDVSLPVLDNFVSDRVDRMVEMGMVDEAREFFSPNCDYSRGIRRAIGVPEFHDYFKLEPILDQKTKSKLLRKVVNEIKMNTRNLARKQLGKIHRLRNVKGWRLHRLDATEVFRKQGKEAAEAWERAVARQSAIIVGQFLRNADKEVYRGATAVTGGGLAAGRAVAAAASR